MSGELVTAAPHPALAGSVLRYEGFDQGDDAVFRFRALPCTFAPLIIEFGGDWHVEDGRRPGARPRASSFAAGLGDGPVMVEHPGRPAACRSTSRRSAPVGCWACR